MKLYRGTQRETLKGRQKLPSYTTELSIAVIYSAVPGDAWNDQPPHFLSTSTIHVAELADDAKILSLCDRQTYCSFAQVLRQLQYGEPEGITDQEARRILNYMHNRLTGKTAGGEFIYVLFDEDGDRRDASELPFSIRDPYTLIRDFRDDFDDYYEVKEVMELSQRLVADTFIFADAPAFRIAAKRLGYAAVLYEDVFAGGAVASEALLGCDTEELEIGEALDLEDEWVPTHDTIRPIQPDAIVLMESVPAKSLLPEVSCGQQRANKRLKKRLLA